MLKLYKAVKDFLLRGNMNNATITGKTYNGLSVVQLFRG